MLTRQLSPIVQGLRSSQRPCGVVRGLELHEEVVAVWANAAGVGWRPRLSRADEDATWMQIDGGLGAGGRDDYFRIIVERQPAKRPGREDRVLAAHVAYLFLPEEIRGAGAGTALLLALEEIWSAMTIEEVHAFATDDGSVAFARWGFWLAPGLTNGPSKTVNLLRQRAGLDSGDADVPVPAALRSDLHAMLDPANPQCTPMKDISRLPQGYGVALLDGVRWNAWRPVRPPTQP